MICQIKVLFVSYFHICKLASNAIIFQDGYAAKRKNRVTAEDRHMRHGKFDESDHEQDIENVYGSSIYFGLAFRGAIEQAMLKIEDDFDFEGYQYFPVPPNS